VATKQSRCWLAHVRDCFVATKRLLAMIEGHDKCSHTSAPSSKVSSADFDRRERLRQQKSKHGLHGWRGLEGSESVNSAKSVTAFVLDPFETFPFRFKSAPFALVLSFHFQILEVVPKEGRLLTGAFYKYDHISTTACAIRPCPHRRGAGAKPSSQTHRPEYAIVFPKTGTHARAVAFPIQRCGLPTSRNELL
jgi:hypothetical protein